MREGKARYEPIMISGFPCRNYKDTRTTKSMCSESWVCLKIPLNPLTRLTRSSSVSMFSCHIMGIHPFPDRPISSAWHRARPLVQGDESLAWRCCLGGCGKRTAETSADQKQVLTICQLTRVCQIVCLIIYYTYMYIYIICIHIIYKYIYIYIYLYTYSIHIHIGLFL